MSQERTPLLITIDTWRIVIFPRQHLIAFVPFLLLLFLLLLRQLGGGGGGVRVQCFLHVTAVQVVENHDNRQGQGEECAEGKPSIVAGRAEIAGDVQVIATGGLSNVIAHLTDRFSAVDPWLTLDGIRLIGERSLP